MWNQYLVQCGDELGFGQTYQSNVTSSHGFTRRAKSLDQSESLNHSSISSSDVRTTGMRSCRKDSCLEESVVTMVKVYRGSVEP